MSNEIEPKERPKTKSSLLILIILLLPINMLFASPCLCLVGAAIGKFKMIFLVLVYLRLLYLFLKRTLKLSDILIYELIIIIAFALTVLLH